MDEDKRKILFLPAWYPNREDAMYGLFVRNHALTVLPYAKVFVIAVVASSSIKKQYEVDINTENNLVELIVYYRKSKMPLFGKAINMLRFIMSNIAGWKVLINGYDKPDLVHLHILTRSGIPALFLKWFKGIPFVITEHWSRYFENSKNYNGMLRKFLTRIIVKNAAAMSTVSLILKEAMNKRGLRNDNWEIIPNSIDTKLFHAFPTKEDDDKIRIFHISCFEEISKNMSGIIRAFSEALKVNNNIELIMIGEGVDLEKTKELTRSLSIQESVVFTGMITGSELIETINKCKFSVLFSHYETFAIVVAESLAAEKPVIASRVGAIPEVLPEEFGIFVSDNDEKALAKSILEMANTYMNYDTDAMREYCVENYDKEEIGHQLYQFYKGVLN